MKLQLAFIAAVFATDCPNENWELDENGDCQPKAEYFTLSCNADGMEIELNEAVFPDAATVFLAGENCDASYDFDTKLWSVNTTLDGCDTQMGVKEDGSLAFSNVLRLDAYSLGDTIYTTPSVLINFECTYDNLYAGIEANDVNVIGENVDAESEAGQGKFTFSLTQYTDADMETASSSEDETELGAVLYFKLTMDNPIENVTYVIDDCTVHDTELEQSYEIISNQCGDDFLEVTKTGITSENLQTSINFSYQGFKFVESVDDETAVNMKLECSVIVCDVNDADSDCAKGCVEAENTE